MASIASLSPSALFPGDKVADSRSWARRTGGNRGPDHVFDRPLCIFLGLACIFLFITGPGCNLVYNRYNLIQLPGPSRPFPLKEKEKKLVFVAGCLERQ
jgi:hypothetical protein